MPCTRLAVRNRHSHRRLQQQRRLSTCQQAGCQRRERRLRIFAGLDEVTPGGSNAAHANLDGGRTEPISTATTRVPMPVIKRHMIRICKLTGDRCPAA
jgi:hypothetical protein